MDVLQFANNANTTVAAPITALSTTVQLLTGAGALFPTPSAGFSFLATFVDAATKSIFEIVLVTARAGDVLTIVRGQEGTTAESWLAGDFFQMGVTAGTMNSFSQIPQTQASAYNVANDTGTTNSYVAAFTPPITTRINGLTLRIKALNSNTGASTLNVGAGSAPIVNPGGAAIGANAIIGTGYFEVIDDTVNYQLVSASQQAQSLSGAATTGDMKFRPTSETIAGWVIANATTIGNASSNATQRANADTSALFAWHWTNFSNTQCPVFTSGGSPTTRGANAAADFAANKQIQVYDKRGHGEIGVDTMQGGTTTRLSGVPVQSGGAQTPGSVIGENLHTLILNELATGITSSGNNTINSSGNNAITVTTAGSPTPTLAGTNGGTITGFGTANGSNGTSPGVTFGSAVWGNVTSMSGNNSINVSATSTINVTSNNTGGGAHNNVMLVDTVTYYLKL